MHSSIVGAHREKHRMPPVTFSTDLRVTLESLQADVEIACTSESGADVMNAMKMVHKKSTLALEVVANAFDSFEGQMSINCRILM